jgi:hypothetical protein
MKKAICTVIAFLMLLLTAAAAFAENTGTAELRGSIDRLEIAPWLCRPTSFKSACASAPPPDTTSLA